MIQPTFEDLFRYARYPGRDLSRIDCPVTGASVTFKLHPGKRQLTMFGMMPDTESERPIASFIFFDEPVTGELTVMITNVAEQKLMNVIPANRQIEISAEEALRLTSEGRVSWKRYLDRDGELVEKCLLEILTPIVNARKSR